MFRLRFAVGRFGWLRATPPPRPAPETLGGGSSRRVWTVRADWPDGSHAFIGPALDQAAGARLWARQVVKWRRSPLRPRLSVVPISLHDFWLHAQYRPGCMAPDCPTAEAAVAA